MHNKIRIKSEVGLYDSQMVVNPDHKCLDENDLPKCCSNCVDRAYVLAGFRCSCRKLRKILKNMPIQQFKHFKQGGFIMHNYEILFYDPFFDLPLDQWDESGFEEYEPQNIFRAIGKEDLLAMTEALLPGLEGYPSLIIDIRSDKVIAGGTFSHDDLDTIEGYFDNIDTMELRWEIEQTLRDATGKDYARLILDQEEFIENIIRNIAETSAWDDEGYYNSDDIRLSIGRELTSRLGIEI